MTKNKNDKSKTLGKSKRTNLERKSVSANSIKKVVRKKSVSQKTTYFTYILCCENSILYTGIATDVKRRLDEHKMLNGSKRGAKFTKSHKPKKIVAIWRSNNRSEASKLEFRIKMLTKNQKNLLINNNRNFKIFFNDLLDIKNYKRIL